MSDTGPNSDTNLNGYTYPNNDTSPINGSLDARLPSSKRKRCDTLAQDNYLNLPSWPDAYLKYNNIDVLWVLMENIYRISLARSHLTETEANEYINNVFKMIDAVILRGLPLRSYFKRGDPVYIDIYNSYEELRRAAFKMSRILANVVSYQDYTSDDLREAWFKLVLLLAENKEQQEVHDSIDNVGTAVGITNEFVAKTTSKIAGRVFLANTILSNLNEADRVRLKQQTSEMCKELLSRKEEDNAQFMADAYCKNQAKADEYQNRANSIAEQGAQIERERNQNDNN